MHVRKKYRSIRDIPNTPMCVMRRRNHETRGIKRCSDRSRMWDFKFTSSQAFGPRIAIASVASTVQLYNVTQNASYTQIVRLVSR